MPFLCIFLGNRNHDLGPVQHQYQTQPFSITVWGFLPLWEWTGRTLNNIFLHDNPMWLHGFWDMVYGMFLDMLSLHSGVLVYVNTMTSTIVVLFDTIIVPWYHHSHFFFCVLWCYHDTMKKSVGKYYGTWIYTMVLKFMYHGIYIT